MKFMFIVKSAHSMAPSPALLEAMHKLANREIKAGRMLDNGGLTPIAEGAQVRIVDGKLSILDGPFVEAKEVMPKRDGLRKIGDKVADVGDASDFGARWRLLSAGSQGGKEKQGR